MLYLCYASKFFYRAKDIIGLDYYLRILKYLYDIDDGTISNNFVEYHKFIFSEIGDKTINLGYFDQGLIINSRNLLYYKNKKKKKKN